MKFFFVGRGFSNSHCDSRPESCGSGSSGYGVSGELQDSHLRTVSTNIEGNRYDTPKWPPVRITNGTESYDIPRPLHSTGTISPSSSISSLALSASDSVPSSNRSSITPDYDVPRSTRPVTILQQQLQKFQENENMVNNSVTMIARIFIYFFLSFLLVYYE